MLITILFILLAFLWVILGVLWRIASRCQPWRKDKKPSDVTQLEQWAWRYKYGLKVLSWLVSILTIITATYYFAIFGSLWLPVLWVILTAGVGQLVIRERAVASWVVKAVTSIWKKYKKYLRFIPKTIQFIDSLVRKITGDTPLYENPQELRALTKHHQSQFNTLSFAEHRQIEKLLKIGSQTIEKKVLPLKKAPFVKVDDTVGPLFLQEMHNSPYGSFVVYETKRSKPLGILDQGVAMSQSKKQTTVASLMDERIVYLPYTATYQQALTTFAETSSPLSVIIDENKQPVGVLYVQDLVRELFESESNEESA